MNQSQEFKGPNPENVLKAAEKAIESTGGERRSGSEELSAKNTNQQFRSVLMSEGAYTAYNAVKHHQTYKQIQKSYNEQRDQYEEQVFSFAAVPVSPDMEKLQPEPQRAEQPSSSIPLSQHETEDWNPTGRNAIVAAGSGEWKSPSMREVEDFGTRSMAEAPDLWKNSKAIKDNGALQEKLDNRRRSVQRFYTGISIGEHQAKDKLKFNYYGRINLPDAGEVRLGRLRYSGHVVRQKMTKEDYENLLRRKGIKDFKRRNRGRLLFRGVKSVMEEESLSEDELTGSMKRGIRKANRALLTANRYNIRKIKKQNNVYARYAAAKAKGQVLQDKRERLLADSKKKQQQKAIKDAASKAQKKKLKKQMVEQRAREEGYFFQRLNQNRLIKRRARKVKQQEVKKTLSTLFAIVGVLFFLVILCCILFLAAVVIMTSATQHYASSVTQNDYGTITDATEYFRELETNLDEYLNADRESLEAELEAEYGPDIYEYVYNLAEFGFSANTLIAYLSAVYGSFDIDTIREELESIFEEMYTLIIEVKVEDRTIREYNPDTGTYTDVILPKNICYVTLEKKELEEVVEPRMTDDQLEHYKAYWLSTGGQQIYGPVMREDWTGLISSNFGERIHPITKVRKEHNGVDIAVPIGTHLYSAVDGTVILAAYSESAGNWVKVQTDTGWTVIFMHMDSLTVSGGQTVKKGDHLGYSGNTGRSTGPHLHLEVRNPQNEAINPIFIIPQTCAAIGEARE